MPVSPDSPWGSGKEFLRTPALKVVEGGAYMPGEFEDQLEKGDKPLDNLELIESLLNAQQLAPEDIRRLEDGEEFTNFQRVLHENTLYLNEKEYNIIFLALFQQVFDLGNEKDEGLSRLLDNIRDCVEYNARNRYEMYAYAKGHIEDWIAGGNARTDIRARGFKI